MLSAIKWSLKSKLNLQTKTRKMIKLLKIDQCREQLRVDSQPG